MERKSLVLKEIKRKSIHVIPGFAAIPIVVWLGKYIAIPIAIIFLLLYTLNELYLNGWIRKPIPIATHTFYIMAREEELRERTFIGTILFWSLTVLIIVFLPPVKAAAAIMISSLGDAAAAITGKAIGITSIPYNKKKTLMGSIAMFATSLLYCLILGIDIVKSIAVSSIATAVESATPISYLDELTVPAIAAVVLYIA